MKPPVQLIRHFKFIALIIKIPLLIERIDRRLIHWKIREIVNDDMDRLPHSAIGNFISAVELRIGAQRIAIYPKLNPDWLLHNLARFWDSNGQKGCSRLRRPRYRNDPKAVRGISNFCDRLTSKS